MKKPFFAPALLVLLTLATGALVGCGSGATEKPTSIASEEQVQNMVKARQIFDESNKDWASLPKDKQEEYTRLVGGKPELAQSWWEKMKNPGGGGANPGSTGGNPTTSGG